MIQASRIRLARELLYCARMILNVVDLRIAMSPRRLDKTEFIQRSIKKWGDGKFEYGDVKYEKNTVKVHLKCIEHDKWFWQTPKDHLEGKAGCEDCKKVSQGEKNFK